jgi:hypothetical protein
MAGICLAIRQYGMGEVILQMLILKWGVSAV